MPLISAVYNPPGIFKNGHFSTIYCSVFRKVTCPQTRERITLDDGDFIDLDWSYAKEKTNTLVIVLHGLEGSAQRPYIKGAAKIFNENHVDACAVNFRSCSGETNKLFSSYHSGKTEDLATVIAYVLAKGIYNSIVLKGFSLGANVILKYLGTHTHIPKEIKGAIAVSAPCDLYGTMLQLHKKENIIYHTKFKKDLLLKLKQKQALFPDMLTIEEVKAVKTLKDFDDIYTAKAHDFKDALDYYAKSSALPNLQAIQHPTLILNAKNDSFLSATCFPVAVATEHKQLYLEMPAYGGHVGFYLPGSVSYSEKRSVHFMKNIIL
ncbi:YheT family hydrolase [Neptunitalea lumnitzerae]|uniref:Alpha/beta hydrolase n=1 Tax=Neptunitalea lumnitzerae TaxID=2965509 RepID=A0ABQ5MF27_9FLAO|nr:alpha/beta fold hydrolase [Neptunitalea sp. Y10]GLB48006.1 alpha/beta hydrolase [Neptunitalea sp. Y10]